MQRGQQHRHDKRVRLVATSMAVDARCASRGTVCFSGHGQLNPDLPHCRPVDADPADDCAKRQHLQRDQHSTRRPVQPVPQLWSVPRRADRPVQPGEQTLARHCLLGQQPLRGGAGSDATHECAGRRVREAAVDLCPGAQRVGLLHRAAAGPRGLLRLRHLRGLRDDRVPPTRSPLPAPQTARASRSGA